MLRILATRSEITAAQERWKKRTLVADPVIYKTELGWQGGNQPATLFWFPSHGLWVAHELERNRWWNPCGLDTPDNLRSPDIVVELNPPFEGLNPGITGAFATDSAGRLCVIHRGWLGGGYHPVSKEAFFRQFRGRTDYVGPKVTHRVAIVGELDSPTFLEELAAFVNECRRMKLGAKGA